MTSSAILPYPIEPVAALPTDNHLAKALLDSMSDYGSQLHSRRIWLACSGGRDSLALAALCVQLYRRGQLPFLPQLLHVNHGLQAGSRDWAAHVAKWARSQQLSCHILTAQVNGHDEQAARQARYNVIRAHINQDDVLLLAHHADDQAETVLMRLIQGAGVKGLSGMQAWRVQTQGVQRNILWRPWLSVRRATISRYAQQLKLPYIDDPTNDRGDNVRSSLRREVLPALTAYNPNAIGNIARSAQLLNDAQAIVSAQAAQDLQQATIFSLNYPPVQRVLSIDALYTLPLYRQRQLLHTWLTQDEPLPPSKQLIDDVLSLMKRHDHDHQTQLSWQGRNQQYSIRRYRQQMYRLSSAWLNWLVLPVTEQTQTFPQPRLTHDIVAKNSLFQDSSMVILLRTRQGGRWQLEIAFEVLRQFISATGEMTLKIVPLSRQQRVQTALSNHPQAGKKLYQTLGVPVWLRDSLVVVSAVCTHKDEDLPLLLVSPFESWVLGSNKALANATNDAGTLISAIHNVLTIDDMVK